MTVGHALWPDLLTPDERARLRPGRPPQIDRTPDVLVVGGGLLGVATAYAAQRAGLGSVVLLEAEQLGAGASGGAAGQLLPEAHAGIDPPVLVDLGRRGLVVWRDLDREIPGGLGVRDLDWLGLDSPAHPLPSALPPGGERLEPRQVATLVPGLRQPTAGVLVRHQARVNPLQAIARLAGHLPGAASGVRVTAVTTDGRRLRSVHSSAGDFRPRQVVFATGNPPRLDGLALDLPWHAVKGHMLVTEPTDLHLPGAVAPLATTIDDGRLMVGGTLDVGDDEPVVRGEIVAAMRAALVAAWPPAGAARPSHQWACFRPAHRDYLPVVDRVPGLDNAWLTSGHYKTGILLAPSTAAALVQWIQTGRRPACLDGLAADRFASA